MPVWSCIQAAYSATFCSTPIRGRQPNARKFDVSEIEPKDVNRAQRYLWARTRIARLSDFQKGKSDLDRKAEITNLGLTYNLLTAYTSFIAVLEEIRNPEGDAKNVKQPLPLPKGVSNMAVGGCATVPEPEMIFLLIGLISILLMAHGRKAYNRGK